MVQGYLSLTQVKDVVPTDHTIDEFTIRIYCDNGKTRCKYCEMTDHPYFRCPGRSADKVVKTGRCFKCHDKGHTINECSNPWRCDYCAQSGHRKFQCEDRKEIENVLAFTIMT